MERFRRYNHNRAHGLALSSRSNLWPIHGQQQLLFNSIPRQLLSTCHRRLFTKSLAARPVCLHTTTPVYTLLDQTTYGLIRSGTLFRLVSLIGSCLLLSICSFPQGFLMAGRGWIIHVQTPHVANRLPTFWIPNKVFIGRSQALSVLWHHRALWPLRASGFSIHNSHFSAAFWLATWVILRVDLCLLMHPLSMRCKRLKIRCSSGSAIYGTTARKFSECNYVEIAAFTAGKYTYLCSTMHTWTTRDCSPFHKPWQKMVCALSSTGLLTSKSLRFLSRMARRTNEITSSDLCQKAY